MSTKIYTAWRCKQKDLNQFLDIAHKFAFEQAVDKFKYYMSLPIADEGKTTMQKFDLVHKACKEAALRHTREFFDIEVGLNIWLYNHKAYIIPIGGKWNDFKLPKFAEDYSYWNNTDEPEDVTRRQWEARGNTWKKINCGTGTADHNARRLYHSIIDMSPNSYNFELFKAIVPINKII